MMRMENQKVRFIIVGGFVILGILFSVQMKSINNHKKSVESSKQTYEELQMKLIREREIGEELSRKLDKNIEIKESFLEQLSLYNSNNTKLRRQWLNAKSKAGFSEVSGSGIIINVTDSKKVGNDILNSIVHDIDILKITNELKEAKAIAICVNGERIISNSEIICAGPTIQINKNRYAVPFEIKAVGNPIDLYEYIENSKVIATLRKFGVSVKISQSDDILIPRYKGRTNLLITGLEVVE